MQAVSAVFLALRILKKPAARPALWVQSNYTEIGIKPCAKDFLILFQAANRHVLVAVREKFARRDFQSVSTIRL